MNSQEIKQVCDIMGQLALKLVKLDLSDAQMEYLRELPMYQSCLELRDLIGQLREIPQKVGLVVNDSKAKESVEMNHPVIVFTRRARNGKYDDLTDEAYYLRCNMVEGYTLLWNKEVFLSDYKVLGKMYGGIAQLIPAMESVFCRQWFQLTKNCLNCEENSVLLDMAWVDLYGRPCDADESDRSAIIDAWKQYAGEAPLL